MIIKQLRRAARRLVFLVLLTLALTSVLFGQAQSGTVVGTLTDQADAVIPGATITVSHDATGFSREVTTNESGQYVTGTFPTGGITVTVEQSGFQKLVRSGLDLTTGDTLTVDLTLTIGNVLEVVEVSDEAPLLQTQTATISNLIDNQKMLQLPLKGRNFVQLLTLTAGASLGNPELSAGLTGFGMRASTNVSVNGSTTHNNSFLVDGMYNRGLWTNNIVMVPPIDSIQEARVMTSNYSAQYGNAAGAVTIVQSRSGTNEFHGSLYEFLRNDRLDANTFFNNRAGARKPAFRRNEFGGTFGGPIQRNKTFVFADYQGIRVRQPSSTIVTIPTDAEKNMVRTGDFSGLGRTIYNPFDAVADGDAVPVRPAFVNNRIPTQLLDPAAANLMDVLPSPNLPGETRNFIHNPSGQQRVDQFDVRLDRNLGSDRLYFKYSYDNSYGESTGALPPAPNSPIETGRFLTGGTQSPMRNYSLTLNYTKLFGSNIVNESRVGAVRNYLDILNADHEFDIASDLGIPNINISDTNLGIPAMSISGHQTVGNTNSFPELVRTVSAQAENILTVVKGNHTLKFGVNFTRHHFNGHTSIAPRGQYSFNGSFTRQAGTGGSNTALADLAIGASPTILRSAMAGNFGLRQFDLAGFAEDAWRANNRLTVTYGMRYEIQSPALEVYDRWSNLDITTGTFYTAAGNDGGLGRRLRELDTNNFAPRLGIAYMLTKDRKTVLRTGGGISYFEAANGGRALHSNPPMNIVQGFAYDQNGAPGLLLSDGVPLPVEPDLTDPAQLTGVYYSFNPRMRTNKSLQWSFGIQRELATDLILDVSYVGSRALNLTNAVYGNQPVPGPGPLGPRRPLFSINPVLGDIDVRTDYGASKYHSLQVKAEKRYTKGLSASMAYTWSTSTANTKGANSSTRPQDSNCYACEWGYTDEFRRHTMVVSHVWELPFGEGRRYANSGILAHVIGNWSVNGIWSLYSGNYVNPGLASSVSNSLGGISPAPEERPDRIADGNLPTDQRTIDRWYDISAFAVPAQFTFGNSGRNVIEGPGFFGLDTAVHRDFPISETTRLTFRWEMFNALNRANFTNPNTDTGANNVGQISNTRSARAMQMALKLTF